MAGFLGRGGRPGPAVPAPVSITGVVGSQIAVGDGNVQIQLAVGGGSVYGPVQGYVPRASETPVLDIPPAPPPVGRDGIVDRAVTALRTGASVQLFGTPGVGRTAVVEEVLRRLVSRQSVGLPGVRLHGAQSPTLTALYQRLSGFFFEGAWVDPDEARLGLEVRRAGIRALIVITDCDLPPGDMDRLLGTFSGCAFLVTSRQRTLYGSRAAFEVDPLSADAARALFAQALGSDPAGLQNVQVEEALRMSGGQPQRLLEHAAFLGRTSVRPGHTEVLQVPLPEQISILIDGLTEPARRVLLALGTFGVPLEPRMFGPVTGLVVADCATELLAAGLVQDKGSVIDLAPDAAQVFTRRGERADARLAAEGLLAHLDTLAAAGSAAGPATDGSALAMPRDPEPRLLLAVAERLAGTGQDALVSRFARAAAPVAMRGGDLEAWARLAVIGTQAASAARREPDLAYFFNEQRTASMLRGDAIAAAAAVAGLAGLLHQEGAHLTLTSVTHHAAKARRVVRVGRRSMSIGHAATAGGAAGAVVVIGVAVAVAAAPAGNSVKPSNAAAATAARTTAPVAHVLEVENLDRPTIAMPANTSGLTVTAQFPAVAPGSVPDAVAQQLDTSLQKPVTDWATAAFAKAVQNTQQGFAGPYPPGTSLGQERSKETTAGLLVSVEYRMVTGDDIFGDTGQILVLRSDTRQVVPISGILTAQGLSSSGMQRIADAISAADPNVQSGYCQALTGAGLAKDLQTVSVPGMPSEPDMTVGVQSGGLFFMIEPGRQNCGVSQPVIPFDKLTGLVDPAIVSLAKGQVPATTPTP